MCTTLSIHRTTSHWPGEANWGTWNVGKPFVRRGSAPNPAGKLTALHQTPYPDFKVTTFLDIEYPRNDSRSSHSYYRTSIGSHMHSIEQWDFQWPWRTPNPVFKVTAFLKSNIYKKRCILGTKLLKNTNRKPYTTFFEVEFRKNSTS